MNGSVLFEGNPLLSGSLNVNTGGNIEPLEIEINENGTREITPPSGVDGYAPITIETNVPQITPVFETLNVTQNGRYTPPSGVAGFDEVNVEVLHPLDTLTVTENGSYEPPTGVYGFSYVNVNVPTPSPVLNTLNITTNGTYTPPSGVDGYDEIVVNVPSITLTQPLVKEELNKSGNTTLDSNLVTNNIYYFDIVESKNGNIKHFGYAVKFDSAQKDITNYDFGDIFRLYIYSDRLDFDRVPDYDATYTCTITLMDSNFSG